jgi:hypothetical protein
VHPPGSDDFESTAVGWLLDVVPPDYRLHGVLRRYPVALATMARHHSRACVEAAREGYRTARTELADALPPQAIDTVLAAYRKEGARLAATDRAVGLVERALRGEVFTPKMSLATTADSQAGHPPTAAQPTSARSTTARSTTAQAPAVELTTAHPKAGPKTAGPKAAQPETAQPKAVQPKAAQPRAGQSKTAGPRRTDPALAGRPARPRKAT